MITFHSPTILPIEAATTMGVSVKESDNAIGKFGTGLKYAIAGVLRLGGTIAMTIAGARYDFTAVPTDIRGKSFGVVHCNGVPCGFTTDLGKHWEPWQLFRELASNALDEGGGWVFGRDLPPAEAVSLIAMRCEAVETAAEEGEVFLPQGRPAVLSSSNGAEVYAGRTRHYYFRGIRAGSFDAEAPVTVNVTSGTLSEDRILARDRVRSELSWAFRSATAWDERTMLEAIGTFDKGSFWVQMVCPFVASQLSDKLLAWLAERPKWIKHPAILEAYRNSRRGGLWEACEAPRLASPLLDLAESLCGRLCVDPIPREKVQFTRDMGDDTLAVTMMDTREVWFSTKIVMLGRDEFLSCYVEEAMHAMTGFGDYTRELQNALFGMVVRLGLRLGEEAEVC